MEFSFSAYKELVNLLEENGYEIVDYNESKERYAILRHDIDLDLKKAADFSDFEADLLEDRPSTYFVLLTSEFYNLFSKESRGYLKRIINNNRTIGLHFDETQYELSDRNLMSEYVMKEIEVLEGIIERKVRAVSMHRPSMLTLNDNMHIDGVVNCYSKEFFEDIKYLSDSRHHWREDVLSIITERRYDKLQILTHPFSYDENNMSFEEELIRFIDYKKQKAYFDLSNNISDFEKLVPSKDYLSDWFEDKKR